MGHSIILIIRSGHVCELGQWLLLSEPAAKRAGSFRECVPLISLAARFGLFARRWKFKGGKGNDKDSWRKVHGRRKVQCGRIHATANQLRCWSRLLFLFLYYVEVTTAVGGRPWIDKGGRGDGGKTGQAQPPPSHEPHSNRYLVGIRVSFHHACLNRIVCLFRMQV